jgi:hypothetical protein
MFPRFHSPTLSNHDQGSRMCQPWRISEAQTLRCSDRGSVAVDAKLWYNNHQVAKYPEFHAKQLRKPSDFLPKTFAIQTSNSIHWEIMESFGKVFLLNFFCTLSMIHYLKAPTNLKEVFGRRLYVRVLCCKKTSSFHLPVPKDGCLFGKRD